MIDGYQDIVPSERKTRQGNLAGLQRIGAEPEAHRKSPQEWRAGVRDLAVTNCVWCQSGLFRDVVDFCFASFDRLEPDVPQEVREQRMVHVGALAVPLNLRIIDDGRRLTASDNAFLVKWNIVVGTSLVAMRQPNPDVGLILSDFASFDSELRLVDNPELVLAIWLYVYFTLPSIHRHLVQYPLAFWASRRWAWVWRREKGECLNERNEK